MYFCLIYLSKQALSRSREELIEYPKALHVWLAAFTTSFVGCEVPFGSLLNTH